jgi:hypothetical protein
MTDRNRVDGERLRAVHHLQRLRTIVGQILTDLEGDAPIPGPDIAQAVAFAGVEVARSLSALAAFDLAARDAEREAVGRVVYEASGD